MMKRPMSGSPAANVLETRPSVIAETVLQDGHGLESVRRLTQQLDEKTTAEKEFPAIRVPESVDQHRNKDAKMLIAKLEETHVAPMTPRRAKRAQQYSSEASKNLKSLNVNFAKSPTKKMKNRADTCLQAEEDVESIALCQDSRVSPRSSLTKPWWSVDGEDIGRGLGVTSWNSRLNVWEIDLTEEEQSASGSTKDASSEDKQQEDNSDDHSDDQQQEDSSGDQQQDDDSEDQ
eukprot:jgi/Phyca11/16219/fgenesh1_pg.PHYCAscaffold_18_\